MNLYAQTEETNESTPYANEKEETPKLRWTCMVVDFSAAQLSAYMYEFSAALKIANPTVSDQDAETITRSYVRGCQIHYFRSVTRVARISQSLHFNFFFCDR